MQRPHRYSYLIQIDASKTVVPAALNLIIRKNFTNLDFKKLFTLSVQSISVQLRTESESMLPFVGTGRVVLTLNIRCFDWKAIEQLYVQQVSFPHFSGHYRQRGSRFGALAAGIGHDAITFEQRVFLLAARNSEENFWWVQLQNWLMSQWKRSFLNKPWKTLSQKLQEKNFVVVDVG